MVCFTSQNFPSILLRCINLGVLLNSQRIDRFRFLFLKEEISSQHFSKNNDKELTSSLTAVTMQSWPSRGPTSARTFAKTPRRAKWSRKASWAFSIKSWMICKTTRCPSSSSWKVINWDILLKIGSWTQCFESWNALLKMITKINKTQNTITRWYLPVF